MTDREKLANLLHSGRDKYFLLEFEANLLADHLIKHGVVVREKGEWILTDAELAEMSCSRCGFTYYGVHDYECMSGFCPDCGCDMRGDKA